MEVNKLIEDSRMEAVRIYVGWIVNTIGRQPAGEQFISNTIYEIFNVSIYLILPISLLLWTGLTIQILNFRKEKTVAEKIEILLVPSLIVIGTLEVIIRFVLSGSLRSIKSYFDYKGWALIFICWIFLVIILETSKLTLQEATIVIPTINKSQLKMVLAIVLSIIWISIRVVFGVNQSLLFLELITIISLVLIIFLTLPKEMTPRILFRWLFIVSVLFIILIVYPGIMVDPPKMETQTYIYLRNQFISMGVMGIVWTLLFSVLEQNEYSNINKRIT
jgi:hypothetical protein